MKNYGAFVTIKFHVSNFCSDEDMEEDPEFDFNKVMTELLRDESILGVTDDEYEILSIEKVEE